MLKYFDAFAGIGGFCLAMPKDWECVGYSEIDKYAIQVYQKHFPTHKNFGDISKIDIEALPDFDLLVGGFPCTDLSIAKKNREGLKGKQSGLFWDLVKILKIKKPKYFVFENVFSMPKESKEEISGILGVQPIMINASLVSAQNRKRLFWIGRLVDENYEKVEIPQPEDREIFLKDILEENVDNGFIYNCKKSYCLPATYYKENIKSLKKRNKNGLMVRIGQIGKGGQGDRIYSTEGKSVNLSANGGGRGAKTGLYLIDHYNKKIKTDGKAKTLGSNPQCKTAIAGQSITDLKSYIRKLTPTECARLQCFPDDWCSNLSNSQQYRCYGNSVCVEVIRHIFKNLASIL